jgi:hypothetical protein
MQAESIDVYCPSCDCACAYFPEVPENCRNCGASFLDLSAPGAGTPADHFPIKPGLLARLGIVGGIAIEAWEHCTSTKNWVF